MLPISVFWLALTAVLFIIEGITVGLVCIWFAFGSTAAFIFSLFLPNAGVIQIVIFLVASFTSLLTTRPIAKKMLKNRPLPTNADRVIGKKAVVTTAITNKRGGRVFVDGQSWSARSGTEFTVDDICVVLAIEGATLIVAPN